MEQEYAPPEETTQKKYIRNLRAVEERIKNNLAGWHGALMPREY